MGIDLRPNLKRTGVALSEPCFRTLLGTLTRGLNEIMQKWASFCETFTKMDLWLPIATRRKFWKGYRCWTAGVWEGWVYSTRLSPRHQWRQIGTQDVLFVLMIDCRVLMLWFVSRLMCAVLMQMTLLTCWCVAVLMQNYFVREILRSFTDLLNKLFTLWRDFGRALNELLVRLALFRDRLEKNKTLFSLASAH